MSDEKDTKRNKVKGPSKSIKATMPKATATAPVNAGLISVKVRFFVSSKIPGQFACKDTTLEFLTTGMNASSKERLISEISKKIRPLANSNTSLSSAYDLLHDDNVRIELSRKSLKQGRYVSLNSEADFRTLKRSLAVRNHLKLYISFFPIEKPVVEATVAETPEPVTEPVIQPPVEPTTAPIGSGIGFVPSGARTFNFEDVLKDWAKRSSLDAPLGPYVDVATSAISQFMKTDAGQQLKKGVDTASLNALAAVQELQKRVESLEMGGASIQDQLAKKVSELEEKVELMTGERVGGAAAAAAATAAATAATTATTATTETTAAAASAASAPTASTAPASASGPVIHSNVICDGCDEIIKGNRYKCVECFDFDLCESCENNGTEKAEHLKTHQMLKIKLPERAKERGGFGRGRSFHRCMRGKPSPELAKELFYLGRNNGENLYKLKVLASQFASILELLDSEDAEDKVELLRAIIESYKLGKEDKEEQEESDEESTEGTYDEKKALLSETKDVATETTIYDQGELLVSETKDIAPESTTQDEKEGLLSETKDVATETADVTSSLYVDSQSQTSSTLRFPEIPMDEFVVVTSSSKDDSGDEESSGAVTDAAAEDYDILSTTDYEDFN
ncbi:DEKNAAC104329 [Brettanomyces naardenensis]|uniref:DEKNAAC104329 n=1 Tax=Brettanomyces naardenensis TaxID=13370 RepID=A0A448YQK3_BRENA|nr:DEKNAAC104329 [Brettanomyces naardenensis]